LIAASTPARVSASACQVKHLFLRKLFVLPIKFLSLLSKSYASAAPCNLY
jgi:hypothetical protein